MSTLNNTPIDVNHLSDSFNHAKVETIQQPSMMSKLKLDKYTLLLIGSSVFFVASLGFWSYVNFFLK